MSWWRRLRAWLGWWREAALLPALARETEADRSVGYRESASQLELRVASIESVITSYEEEANALDQRALEHLDGASVINNGAADAINARRNAQEKRRLVADLRKRAGLT